MGWITSVTNVRKVSKKKKKMLERNKRGPFSHVLGFYLISTMVLRSWILCTLF